MSHPALRQLHINAKQSTEPNLSAANELEQNVQTLESTLFEVRDRLIKVEIYLEHTATREDVAKMESALVKWLIGSAVALSSLAFAAARWIR